MSTLAIDLLGRCRVRDRRLPSTSVSGIPDSNDQPRLANAATVIDATPDCPQRNCEVGRWRGFHTARGWSPHQVLTCRTWSKGSLVSRVPIYS